MKNAKGYFRTNKLQKILIVVLLVTIFFMAILFYMKERYRVKTVTVIGNQHYTSEQIQKIVMSGKYGDNSMYLYFKYKYKKVDNVPFVETMDVTIVSPSEIKITVYEKAIAGYVEYLGRYMYFDKDGIVVESSESQVDNLPYVTGLKFDYVVMYEKLPIENEQIFKEILSITQLLTKYRIKTTKIYFDQDLNIVLYFDQAKVQIGNMNNIDEKMIKLQYIVPKLEGLSGTLYMENYQNDSKEDYITFQRDDVQSHSELNMEEILVSENQVQVSGNVSGNVAGND